MTAGNTRSNDDIKMDGFAVWSFINSKVPQQIKSLLEKNQLQITDIDLFIFHQASLMTIESLMKIMRLEKDKVFINISEMGNTVSASIPIAVKDAMDTGRLHKGQTIILMWFWRGTILWHHPD
jgi:3-oxoacyl-[acyl-carrier-protein] synthase-3